MTQTDTTAPATAEPLQVAELLQPVEPDALLKMASRDMLDRIVELGREAQGVQIIELTRPAGMIGVPEKIPVLFARGVNPSLKSIADQFEAYRLNPARRSGTAKTDTLQSFISLVKRHADTDSAIFVATKFPNVTLTAVIDYNRPAKTDDATDKTLAHEARFGKHRVQYAFPLTDEYKAWMEKDGKAFDQAEFAIFLEDHAAELAAPLDAEKSLYEPLFKEKFALPLELITLSRELEIFVNAKIKQAVRVQSGERTIVFESEHVNSSGEPVVVPGIFMISLPAWIDGNPVRIPVRIRHRVKDGAIIWFYQLYRAEFWLREQIINDAEEAAKETSLPVYLGSPEA